MKKRRNNSDRASTLQIALSTGLIWIFAILLAIAAPTNTKKAPRQDRYGFQLGEGAATDSITVLGNYPATSVPLSGDTTVTPDAAPSNTTSINVSTDTNFEGKLEGNPMSGVVCVTNAHPAGTYTVTLTAFNGVDPGATKTFALTVTTPATCPQASFATTGNFDVLYDPYSVVVGDFNGDGKQDLATGGAFAVSIVLGDGTGRFGAATNLDVGFTHYSVAVGDFNADGKQDLASAEYGNPYVSIFLGDGAGHFGAPVYFDVGTNGGNPSSVAVGDFNGDGKQDLAVPAANYASHNVTILLRDCAAPTPTPTPSGTPLPTTHFAVSAPEYVYQGFAFLSRITAKDQFNNTVTGYLGTVQFTSTGLSYLPPNCPLPNGTGLFMTTLNTLGYQTITATDTSDPSISGTSNPIFVQSEQPPSPSPSPTPTATATATATAAATASPTPTATPSPTAPAQSLNLSSRMLVQTGDRVGIAGIIITGGAPKRVIVRAVHCMICIPEVFPLVDPVLELHGPSGFATIINDNWRDTQEGEIIATGLVPDNDSDSAVVVTLPPGNYTAIVRGKSNTSGVALVEVYDLSQAAASKLANIGTRAFVSTGGDILIAGFILGNGTMPDNVIVRGIGPGLAGLGVPNALADPRLELRDSNGALIRANDNWMDDPAQQALIMAAGLAPTNPLESAIAETLPPGRYTALLAGVNNGTGNGLVEVYDLGP